MARKTKKELDLEAHDRRIFFIVALFLIAVIAISLGRVFSDVGSRNRVNFLEGEVALLSNQLEASAILSGSKLAITYLVDCTGVDGAVADEVEVDGPSGIEPAASFWCTQGKNNVWRSYIGDTTDARTTAVKVQQQPEFSSDILENETLFQGSVKNSTTAVGELQELLIDAGYLDAESNGFFRPATNKALLEFQSDSGLEPDGIAGQDTFDALQWNTISDPYYFGYLTEDPPECLEFDAMNSLPIVEGENGTRYNKRREILTIDITNFCDDDVFLTKVNFEGLAKLNRSHIGSIIFEKTSTGEEMTDRFNTTNLALGINRLSILGAEPSLRQGIEIEEGYTESFSVTAEISNSAHLLGIRDTMFMTVGITSVEFDKDNRSFVKDLSVWSPVMTLY